MSSIASDLARLLEGVTRPGDFCVTGDFELLPPGLEVEGVGPIALPLLPRQARDLIAAADRAPYGRGGQTLVDTEVRRTWQINADRVRMRGRAWDRTLAAIVARAAEGLGVTGPVEAELYKLLVYDKGAFFVSHRDTEKTPGMFATLVIVPPSLYTGGELVVRHRDREVRVDLGRDDPAEAAFATFYADCAHEILPVTSGVKLSLVYNLTRVGRGAAPKPADHDAERDALTLRLRDWVSEREDGDVETPDKLIYPLEHVYTQESLTFEALKGADAGRAATLASAARAAGCDLHLALLSIEESGSAEYGGDYRRSYRRRHDDDVNDDDNFEIGEVFDRIESLSHWRTPEGDDPGWGELPIDEAEVSPPGVMEDFVPDEQSFQEAAGNEGASFERSYRKAALVLWPVGRRLAVINQGGLATTLPFLKALADRWIPSEGGRDSPLWIQAHDLAGHMTLAWPRSSWRSDKKPGEVAHMLTALIRLGDTERIDGFLASVGPAGVGDKTDNDAVLAALRLLPVARAMELIAAIVAGGSIGAASDLLAKAAAVAEWTGGLAPAAQALFAVLPGDPALAKPDESWRRRQAMEADIVIDALTALDRIDPPLAARALERMLAWPRTYDPDEVIVPAAVGIRAQRVVITPSVARLIAVAQDHLRVRIALPLAPPDTWERSSAVTCACANCKMLSRFLADPTSSTWHFKAAQADRLHVESTIRHSRCDLFHTTLRKGSPHVLACIKTQASYERRVKQRREDITALTRIGDVERR